MLITPFFKGANLYPVILRKELVELAMRKYKISEQEATAEADRIINHLSSTHGVDDNKIIHGAYLSHGFHLLKDRLSSKGIESLT